MLFRLFRAPSVCGIVALAACSTNGDAPTDGPIERSAAAIIDVSRSVLTQKNDNGRSGAMTHETSLTAATVRSGFGRVGRWKVDGQIAAQPLYVHGLTIGTRTVNAVVVATRTNSISVFDADSTAPSGNLIFDPIRLNVGTMTAAEMPGMDHRVAGDDRGLCKQTHGPVGITATPVIDASGKMYVVARVAPRVTGLDGGRIATDFNAQYGIFTVDLTTGTSTFHVTIQSPASVFNARDNVFDPNRVLNRPALLLDHGKLYVAFGGAVCDSGGGSEKDGHVTHGWVFAYDATTFAQLGALNTSFGTGFSMAGVWQSGQGLAADAAGNVYLQTGNNEGADATHFEASARGEEILKLSLSGTPSPSTFGFQVSDYRVQRWQGLDGGDTDLAAGGVALLPGGKLLGGGKEGRLYVLDTASMTPLPVDSTMTFGATDGALAYRNTWHPEIPPDQYYRSQELGPNIHGAPVVWTDSSGRTHLYAMPEKEFLTRYTLRSNGTIDSASRVQSTHRSPDGMPGGALSLSSNGGANGIVWASGPMRDELNDFGPGRLMAFDAQTLELLYSDESDGIAFAKYTPPTVADGKVFRPSFGNELIVYGALSSVPAAVSACRTTRQAYDALGGLVALGPWPQGADGNAPRMDLTLDDFNGAGPAFGESARHTAIFSSASTCAHLVRESMLGVYDRSGGPTGPLGYPVTDDMSTVDDRLGNTYFDAHAGPFVERYTHFEHGSIFYASRLKDAHYTYGPIRDLWATLGWDRGLGFPADDPKPFSHGLWQPFDKFAAQDDPILESAITYSSQTGAHTVVGGIYAFWKAHPSLGLATDEEHDGASPDGRAARVSDFENGSIYWIKASAAAGDPETFGVWHPSSAAEWFDLTNSDVRRTQFDFADVETTTWAQAARAATSYCTKSGFVGGHFTGEQTRTGATTRGVVCYARGAQFFDASYASALQGQTWRLTSSDLDANAWAAAGRASDEFCSKRGFASGFFTGHQVGDLRGVVCSNPPASVFDAHDAEINATGWGFADVNTASWSQAARAAHHVCIAHATVGGRFVGHQVPDLRKLVCQP